MLIANHFHFEHNCAILSLNGYPEPIFATVMEMLRRNPDLKVFAIHDCSWQGVQMIEQLRTSDRWFKDSHVTIIDLGLRPQQIIQAASTARDEQDFQYFVEQQSQTAKPLPKAAAVQSAAEISLLTPEEQAWLKDGYWVSLESFTPHKLIQILTRSIATSQSIDAAPLADVAAGSSFVAIGDEGYFAAESFG